MNEKAIRRTDKITITLAGLVIAAAAVLSYTALRDLFQQINLFSNWLGYLFPLLFDLAEVTAAVAVFNAKLQGEDDRFAWGLVVGATIAGIGANIAHAWFAYHTDNISQPQLYLAAVMTSLFPLSVAFVTHLVKKTVGRQIKRGEVILTTAILEQRRVELQTIIDGLTADVKALTADIDIKTARLSELSAEEQVILATSDKVPATQRRAARLEQMMTDIRQYPDTPLAEVSAELAERYGVSARTIERDLTALAEAGRIHLNGTVEIL